MGFSKIKNTISKILKLPVISVVLDHTDDGNRLYRAFTRQHPRYLIIKQKTIGVAIIQLGEDRKSVV